MPDVAIVAVAQTDLVPSDPAATTPEMAFDVAHRAVAASGLGRREIDLTVSASSDMLEGRPFNFVRGLEALGAWPAVAYKHLEMDGAWAAWHAWAALLAGEASAALVVAWSKTSEASLHHVLNTRLDPFTLAPLGLDDVACAALQADAYLTRVGLGEDTLDAAVDASRRAAASNPRLGRMSDSPDGDAPAATPLRVRHLPRPADGACAIVLAAGDVAARVCRRPVWIRGADHRIEPGSLGHRDLSRVPAASRAAAGAAERAGWSPAAAGLAEIGASYAHQTSMLREALGLAPTAILNPSGGPLAADPISATGLIRLAEAAGRVAAGDASRAVAHAAAGAAMQHHIVWLLEAA